MLKHCLSWEVSRRLHLSGAATSLSTTVPSADLLNLLVSSVLEDITAWRKKFSEFGPQDLLNHLLHAEILPKHLSYARHPHSLAVLEILPEYGPQTYGKRRTQWHYMSIWPFLFCKVWSLAAFFELPAENSLGFFAMFAHSSGNYYSSSWRDAWEPLNASWMSEVLIKQ